MRNAIAALALCAWLIPAVALGDTSRAPLEWLGRIASAGQRLNYTGTFIYQSGRDFETSRITHKVDANGEHERLEVLDGSPREVIRSNNQVQCVLPDQKLVIVDQGSARRAFPARLPASYAGVAENYRITLGGSGRVAGLDVQQILLEPKDELRFGHVLWADVETGLLLKARMVDDQGEVIEQFTFTDVRIGGEIEMEALRPRFIKNDQWKVVSARGDEVRPEDKGWVLEAPVVGYELKSVVRRPLGQGRKEVLHIVYSDGLAAISVFIEPTDADSGHHGIGAMATGPISMYKRVVSDHLITVLGEVPMAAVRQIGDGMVQVGQ
ncbi:MAG TPA: MucB/RseB C-terminal domain-containing protein [Rhodocyclaceae bacterium]|nr:MucB/RseB C-terminal domain-containing protein [Rhodocyclaceae bacterium]